jgi:hypothetical protein
MLYIRESLIWHCFFGEANNVCSRIIRQALGLPEHDKTTNSPSLTPKIKMNVILEAEMVAFSDSLHKIDGMI